MRCLVVDLEAAIGKRQPVDRLSRARHRLCAAVNQGGEVEASKAVSAARERDWHGALVARHGDRQRAVGCHPQAQVEAVQLEATNLHLREKQAERVETDLASRRGQHCPPDGVAHGQMAEAQAHAPGIVHEVGRAEVDRIAAANALLQARGDSVVQGLQIDRSVGQPRRDRDNGEKRNDHCGFRHARGDAQKPP